MTHVYTRERHENKNIRFWATDVIIDEPKTMKIRSMDDVWKSEEEITKTRLKFTLIFCKNTGQLEKYIQTLLSRTPTCI